MANDGFVSAMLLLICPILLATGWKRELIGDLQIRGLALLAVISLPLTAVTMEFGAFTLNAGLLPLAAWSIRRLFQACSPIRTIHLFFVVLMTFSCWIWLRRMYAIDPVFVLLHPKWDAPLMAGLLSALLTRRSGDQILVVILTVLAGETLLAWMGVGPEKKTVGGPGWWDDLGMAFLSARSFSGMLLSFLRLRHKAPIWRKLYGHGGNTET